MPRSGASPRGWNRFSPCPPTRGGASEPGAALSWRAGFPGATSERRWGASTIGSSGTARRRRASRDAALELPLPHAHRPALDGEQGRTARLAVGLDRPVPAEPPVPPWLAALPPAVVRRAHGARHLRLPFGAG